MDHCRVCVRALTLIICALLSTFSQLPPAAAETQVYHDLASFAMASGPLTEIDFENLEQSSSDPHDPEGGYIPNPLTLEGVTFFSPHSLGVGYCSSPTCQSDPDRPGGGNMVLFMGQDSTIHLPRGTGGVLLVVEGLGDVPFAVQVIDWDGNSITAGGQGILYGVAYLGFSSDVGIQEIRIAAVGPTPTCPYLSCGPLVLSAVWVESDDPAIDPGIETGVWTDPADVVVPNHDLLFGSATIDDDRVDLRVRFSDRPFIKGETQEISWCLDTDQDLTTGNTCGVAGADAEITLHGDVRSLFGGKYTLRGLLAGVNPCSISHFNKDTNTLRLAFPRSYLPGIDSFRYTVRSTLSFSQDEIYTDWAPNTGELDLTSALDDLPPFDGPSVCSLGKSNKITVTAAAAGYVAFFPELGITHVWNDAGIQSVYSKTTAQNRCFRRGLVEFDLPTFPAEAEVAAAFLVLTDGSAASSMPVPPDLHEVGSYALADLTVSAADYSRAVTSTGHTIETDWNLSPQTFSLDVTDLFAVQPSPESIGFRVQLAVDPVYNEIDELGVGFNGTNSSVPVHLLFVFAKASKSIDPEMEHTLVYTGPSGAETEILVPADTFTDTTELLYDSAPLTTTLTPAAWSAATIHATAGAEVFVGDPFVVDAFVGSEIDSTPALQKPLTVTLRYTDADIAGLDEKTLVLNHWNGSQWAYAACGPYDRRPDENTLAVPVCDLGEFQLFGREQILLSSLSLAGPVTAELSTTVTLTTTAAPLGVSMPITYHWQATGQADVVHTVTAITDTASFAWTTPGTMTVTITATDASGAQASATHRVEVSAPVQEDNEFKVYLPLTVRMEDRD